jgi:hypothetical protein
MNRSTLLVLACLLFAATSLAQGPPPPAMPPPASSTPGDVALHDGVLYAVGKGRRVRRASLSQARPSVLVEVSGDDSTRLNGVAAARAGIAFTVEDGNRGGRVMAAAHDGSKLRTLWTGAGSPEDIAFHGGEVVWTNREAGTVCKTPFAGRPSTSPSPPPGSTSSASAAA